MKLLCLSNGHGEDVIAVRILQALQQTDHPPELAALPLVGEGNAYRQADIPIAGAVQAMPSGGFIYMDGRQLVRDIRGGLVGLTLSQLRTVKTWAKQGGKILAVGDIVPLLMAWWSGAAYAFVGTAKSEYYLRDEVGWLPRKSWWSDRLERSTNCIYLPWERWLMRRSRCQAVFPRDQITATNLQQFGIPAFDLGNPMMDGLGLGSGEYGVENRDRQEVLTLLLLPGSRAPEAYRNWDRLLVAVDAVMREFQGQRLRILAAIAPSVNGDPLADALKSHGWQSVPLTDGTDAAIQFSQGRAHLSISQTAYAAYLRQADVAIAMAGTATEQFVGLGKPAIAIPGKGPQFTPAFAEAQTRLLGPSVTLIPDPNQVGTALQALLADPDRLHLIGENGRRRLGEPGAAQRIANCLVDIWGHG